MKHTGSGASAAEPTATQRTLEIEHRADHTDATTEALRLVLLAFEGKGRGFKNTLAFRRWCRRHGVTVVNDGRLQWVDRVEVEAALARLVAKAPNSDSIDGEASAGAANPLVDPVALAVETLIFTRRNR